jgi:hypothetical protein
VKIFTDEQIIIGTTSLDSFGLRPHQWIIRRAERGYDITRQILLIFKFLFFLWTNFRFRFWYRIIAGIKPVG